MDKKYRKFEISKDKLNFVFSYNKNETAALHAKINNNSLIDVNDLRRISLWKLDRVLSVSEEALAKLRQVASESGIGIDQQLVKDVIEELVASDGIGFPMASAILKFLRPDIFPIIDVRAYRALTGTKPYYSTYSYERYVEYARALTEIARCTKRPLKEIDEQLYCFDAEYNGKI